MKADNDETIIGKLITTYGFSFAFSISVCGFIFLAT